MSHRPVVSECPNCTSSLDFALNRFFPVPSAKKRLIIVHIAKAYLNYLLNWYGSMRASLRPVSKK